MVSATMEVIGPQRIHHSPFAPLAHAQPRSRQMLETFHQQSSTAGASATTASRSTTAAASRDKASGRNKKGRDSVHPPRIREDKRPATERPQQQQQPQQQRRSTTETRKLENSGASSAIATVATPASSTAEKGREARGSTSESRRQPPRQQNQRYSTAVDAYMCMCMSHACALVTASKQNLILFMYVGLHTCSTPGPNLCCA